MILLLNTDLIRYKALGLDKLYLASKNSAEILNDSFYGSNFLASEIFHSLKEDYKVLSYAGGENTGWLGYNRLLETNIRKTTEL